MSSQCTSCKQICLLTYFLIFRTSFGDVETFQKVKIETPRASTVKRDGYLSQLTTGFGSVTLRGSKLDLVHFSLKVWLHGCAEFFFANCIELVLKSGILHFRFLQSRTSSKTGTLPVHSGSARANSRRPIISPHYPIVWLGSLMAEWQNGEREVACSTLTHCTHWPYASHSHTSTKQYTFGL